MLRRIILALIGFLAVLNGSKWLFDGKRLPTLELDYRFRSRALMQILYYFFLHISHKQRFIRFVAAFLFVKFLFLGNEQLSSA